MERRACYGLVAIMRGEYCADTPAGFVHIDRAVGDHVEPAKAETTVPRPLQCFDVLIGVNASVVLRALLGGLEFQFDGTTGRVFGKRAADVQVFIPASGTGQFAFQVHQEQVVTFGATKVAISRQDVGEVVLERRF